jgi:hypothetical protein
MVDWLIGVRNPVSGFLALTAVENKVKTRVSKDCQGELVEPDALNETRLRQAQADILIIFGVG